MTQYLGISMIIVVTGLVVAVLARLITGGILDEVEKIRVRRSRRRLNEFGTYVTELTKFVKENKDTLIEGLTKSEKVKKEESNE